MKLLIKALFEVSRRTPHFRGKHKVLWYVVRALSTRDYFHIMSGGAKFAIRGQEMNEYWMGVRGVQSPPIFNKICELAGDDPKVVWDIGGNIGTMALPLLATKPNIEVVAFEPSPEPCSRLLRNAFLNPSLLSRLTVFNCALGSVAGLTKFYVSNRTDNSGVGGMSEASNRESFPIYTMVETAAEITKLAPKPDIIKIDVEGHELEVLKGLLNTFCDERLSIIFEHEIYRLNETGQARTAVADFLKSKGFEIYSLEGDETIDWEMTQDILAVR